MNEYYGWSGQILRIDLSKRKISKQALPKNLALNFIGGRGINSKILYDETDHTTNPLGPENRLIIGTGPITGTFAPSAGRFTVTTKSPLTGLLGDGNSGGEWGPELKYAGYDHIVFQGKSPEPVYIWIDDDKVDIKSASYLWGRDTWETEDTLKEELGDPEIQVLCIGPAGENIVRFACPINNYYRAPGRCGTGAVMGSKNLKAIAVRGTKGVKVADPEKFEAAVKKYREKLRSSDSFPLFSKYGTSTIQEAGNVLGLNPMKNFREPQWPEEKLRPLYPESVYKYVVRKKACFCCITQCDAFVSVREGPFKGEKGGKPEYESVAAFGLKPCITDFPAVLHSNNLVNKYGMDAISTGNAIAAAMEWYERGIITKEDVGYKLEWGDYDAFHRLLSQTARREGFGNILAEGAYIAAKKLGKGAEKYVVQTKGLDHDSWHYGIMVGASLNHCMATRGGDHLRGFIPDEGTWMSGDATARYAEYAGISKEGIAERVRPTSYDPLKVEMLIHYENICTAADLLEVCKFNTAWCIGGVLEDLLDLLVPAIGIELNINEFRRICERVYNLERSYLVREGITRKDDIPPPRYTEEAVAVGPFKGARIHMDKFEKLKDIYYEKRGWDKNTGIPTKEKLHELGLE